jgi:hypothetical protein
LSHAQKQPNLQDLLNQDKNNNKPNPKSWLWNNKNKNKNMTLAKQMSNIIFLQEKKKTHTRLWQENVPKLVLNKLKVIGNFIYIYTHWAPSSKNKSQETSNLHVAYIHSCVPMCKLWANRLN